MQNKSTKGAPSYKGGKNQKKWSNNKSKFDNRGAKDRRGGGSKVVEDKSDPTNNDPSWYKDFNQIRFDAGNFAYNDPLGIRLANVVDNPGFTFPGVAALHFCPTVGDTSSPTSPINMQARKLMSFLRSKVSNKLDFAAADVMMYLIAMDSMYMLYSHFVRIYALHNAYISVNRYYPEHIYEAMNLAIGNESEWNDFRVWLNTWAYQLSQVFVPAQMTYFARHMWMTANVYLDAPSGKAQSYVFVPDYVYKWSPTTDPHGTELILTKIPAGSTLQGLKEFGSTLLEDLIADKDMAELSGLVLRAYGEQNCIKLSTIPEDFAIAPVYNPEVLTQINNATIVGSIVTDNGAGNIRQTDSDTMLVDYKVKVPTTSCIKHLVKDRLLNSLTDAPTVDDTFVATRLAACGYISTGTSEATLTYFGTEVVTSISILSMGHTDVLQSSCVTTEMVDYTRCLGSISAFRSFPFIYTTSGSSTTSFSLVSIIGDVTNAVTMSAHELEKIHSAATMALFNVPTVGM